jgi:hypothetical protein
MVDSNDNLSLEGGARTTHSTTESCPLSTNSPNNIKVVSNVADTSLFTIPIKKLGVDDIKRHLDITMEMFGCTDETLLFLGSPRNTVNPINKMVKKSEVFNQITKHNLTGEKSAYLSINQKVFVYNLKKQKKEEIVTTICDIFIDIDTAHEAGIRTKTATEEELTTAYNQALQIKEYLEQKYDCKVFIAFSGNGVHLHIPVPITKISTEETEFWREKYKLFGKQIIQEVGIETDSKVFEPVRKCTAYGSLNVKVLNDPRQTFWMGELYDMPLEEAKKQIESARTQNMGLFNAFCAAVPAQTKGSNIVAPKSKKLDFKEIPLDEITAEYLQLIKNDEKLRPCIRDKVTCVPPVGSGHTSRLAVRNELRANGYTDEKIITVFSIQPNFDEEKTRKALNEPPIPPFECKTLMEIGFCTSPICFCDWRANFTSQGIDYDQDFPTDYGNFPPIMYKPTNKSDEKPMPFPPAKSAKIFCDSILVYRNPKSSTIYLYNNKKAEWEKHDVDDTRILKKLVTYRRNFNINREYTTAFHDAVLTEIYDNDNIWKSENQFINLGDCIIDTEKWIIYPDKKEKKHTVFNFKYMYNISERIIPLIEKVDELAKTVWEKDFEQIQMALGTLLLSGRKPKQFNWLYAKQKNTGRSTFLEIVKTTLHPYLPTRNGNEFFNPDNQFSLEGTEDCLGVLIDEMKGVNIDGAQIAKRILGAHTQAVNKKHKAISESKNNLKPFVISNNICELIKPEPTLSDKIIYFNSETEKLTKDDTIVTRYTDSEDKRQAFFSWLMQGAEKYVALQGKEIPKTSCQDVLMSETLAGADDDMILLKHFISCPDGAISVDSVNGIRDDFYAEHKKLKRPTRTKTEFHELLAKKLANWVPSAAQPYPSVVKNADAGLGEKATRLILVITNNEDDCLRYIKVEGKEKYVPMTQEQLDFAVYGNN